MNKPEERRVTLAITAKQMWELRALWEESLEGMANAAWGFEACSAAAACSELRDTIIGLGFVSPKELVDSCRIMEEALAAAGIAGANEETK